MKYLINKFLKLLGIILIFRTGYALGEQLYISSLIEKIKNNKLIIFTTCPELFFENPSVFKIVDIGKKNLFKKLLVILMKNLLGSNIILFYPKKFQNLNDKNYLNFYQGSKHVLEINAERSDIKFEPKDLRNFFLFF